MAGEEVSRVDCSRFLDVSHGVFLRRPEAIFSTRVLPVENSLFDLERDAVRRWVVVGGRERERERNAAV